MQSRNSIRAVASGDSDSGKRKPYGTAPIELDLADAVDLTLKIGQEGPFVSLTTLAILAGHTVTSSATTRKISALQAYGLLEKQGPEQYALTDLGKSIVFPRSGQAAMEAKKAAFLNVGKYSLVYQQNKGKLLPADEFLKNIFEQDGNIPREYSERWVEAFKSGARVAGLLHDRGAGRIQISDSPVMPSEPPSLESPRASPEATSAPERIPDRPNPLAPQAIQHQEVLRKSSSGHFTSIELSNGQRAEFSVPDHLSAKDANKLKRAIDGLKAIIESMIAESDTHIDSA